MHVPRVVRVKPRRWQPEDGLLRLAGLEPFEKAAGERGFTLAEALVALALLATALASMGQLAAIAAGANLEARQVSALTAAAFDKMEQLRALAWGFDALGLPVSDATSDASRVPSAGTGGHGLMPSPPGTLDADTAGYCDYLSADGSWKGSGPGIPTGAVYVRRWTISPLQSNPEALVLTVRAGRIPQSAGSGNYPLTGAATLHTIRVRVGG
ncbi:MAG: prepilin-type N-terminal cleavage/methylation domain-containing protein [Vicinamibacterales bacterium]